MTTRSTFTASLSPSERAAYGRQARKRAPRSSQGSFRATADRPDPIGVIERQSESRLPELVPIRYGRMLESPFRFYRGAAAIMAMDLATMPDTGLTVQLCGDAHLLNFRLMASPERHLVFDINDFDETLPGPFEWDVKRLAASLVVAGRANGFSTKEQSRIVRACVEAYRQRMREFAGMRTLDVWYAQDDTDRMQELMSSSMDRTARRRTARATARARTRTHLQAFAKLTQVTAEGRRIAPDPPLITPLRDLSAEPADEQEKELSAVFDGYAQTLSSERRHLLRYYHRVDMARKVVGVGSVGTRCWILLMVGRDDTDPLLFQAKEAQESVLAPHTGGSQYDNQGHRVVAGQRLIQTTSDIFLGWTHVVGLEGRGRDFYVRQLRDWKGIPRPETMDPALMSVFARLCGASLARAHARSGDPVAIAAYLGSGNRFDRALTEFAQAYADRNEQDFEALRAAARSGRVQARDL
ncbi:hypothetical protein LK08_11270 [Streptomyces sp. MUSC 125]|uniref:DUF2252 domain-containing protein n=1 Tax=Streptomyces sp. MUSC 125 TaxID=1428624 RepID=UPI00057F0F99|nr:DUF2252 domain-containing protein [Streptomyces sp. MUSC 125]KIE26827.1 hypothetical protein LK08_11270 [Streptomyces sp. MUSC 125]